MDGISEIAQSMGYLGLVVYLLFYEFEIRIRRRRD